MIFLKAPTAPTVATRVYTIVTMMLSTHTQGRGLLAVRYRQAGRTKSCVHSGYISSSSMDPVRHIHCCTDLLVESGCIEGCTTFMCFVICCCDAEQTNISWLELSTDVAVAMLCCRPVLKSYTCTETRKYPNLSDRADTVTLAQTSTLEAQDGCADKIFQHSRCAPGE